MTTKQIYSELNSGTVNQKNILFIPHSRANKVIEELNLKQLSKLNLTIGYDITNDNEYLLRNDKIDILINQNPELQGYMAVQTIYKNHFFNYDIEPNNYFPIEIVTKENIDFTQKF
jgi:LacI family transcriptional regulator